MMRYTDMSCAPSSQWPAKKRGEKFMCSRSSNASCAGRSTIRWDGRVWQNQHPKSPRYSLTASFVMMELWMTETVSATALNASCSLKLQGCESNTQMMTPYSCTTSATSWPLPLNQKGMHEASLSALDTPSAVVGWLITWWNSNTKPEMRYQCWTGTGWNQIWRCWRQRS